MSEVHEVRKVGRIGEYSNSFSYTAAHLLIYSASTTVGIASNQHFAYTHVHELPPETYEINIARVIVPLLVDHMTIPTTL